jgi:hypothetical protein
MSEPGIPLVIDGHVFQLRGIAVELRATREGLPVWYADVDGAEGKAHSLENAILYAARTADTSTGATSA